MIINLLIKRGLLFCIERCRMCCTTEEEKLWNAIEIETIQTVMLMLMKM